MMIEHGNFASFVEASNKVFRVGHGSRVLQFASFSFDGSILEWATALSTGACLCFAAFPHALVGDYLADVIDQNSITFMQITPSALTTLPVTRNLESLRQISIGGEAVPLSLIQRWQQRVDLVNAYGPTETALLTLLCLIFPRLVANYVLALRFPTKSSPNTKRHHKMCQSVFQVKVRRFISVIAISPRYYPVAMKARFASRVARLEEGKTYPTTCRVWDF